MLYFVGKVGKLKKKTFKVWDTKIPRNDCSHIDIIIFRVVRWFQITCRWNKWSWLITHTLSDVIISWCWFIYTNTWDKSYSYIYIYTYIYIYILKKQLWWGIGDSFQPLGDFFIEQSSENSPILRYPTDPSENHRGKLSSEPACRKPSLAIWGSSSGLGETMENYIGGIDVETRSLLGICIHIYIIYNIYTYYTYLL